MNEILPDRLKSGMILVTHTGHIVEVVRTSKKSLEGEPLVRLRHPSGVIGHQMFTRDDLASEGVMEVNP